MRDSIIQGYKDHNIGAEVSNAKLAGRSVLRPTKNLIFTYSKYWVREPLLLTCTGGSLC